MATFLQQWETYWAGTGGTTPSYQDWYGRIRVYLDSQSVANNTSTIRIDHYIIGYKSHTAYNPTVNNMASKYRCNNGEYKTASKSQVSVTATNSEQAFFIGSTYHTVQHNNDGTATLSVNGSLYAAMQELGGITRTSSFSGVTLPTIPRSPTITNVSILETNTAINNLVNATEFVTYLSKKKFTITATPYDSSSTITEYKVTNGNYSVTSTTNEIELNFTNHDIFIENGVPKIVIEVTASNGSKATQTITTYTLINYQTPSIIKTASNIKRKTGGGTSLTDNIALLNLNGTFYKENDNIGNNNTITFKYKCWKQYTTEPSYTTLAGTISGGTITITDYQLSNIDYLSIYNYKLQITDSFGKTDIKEDIVSVGISIFTEYKDRVDFLRLTIQQQEIYPNIYSSTETIIGIDNDKPRYRKVIDFGALPNNTTKSVNHDISNLDMIKKVEINGYDSTNSRWFPIPFVPAASMYGGISIATRITTTTIDINCSGDMSSSSCEVTLEYTKTSD